jgi:RNA polymerase sigma-70 factor (ECF subfamily)
VLEVPALCLARLVEADDAIGPEARRPSRRGAGEDGSTNTMKAGAAGEGELLRRAGGGDEAAFLLLYERHRTPVFRFACRMLGSTPLAEDVTQECFLSILKRPEGFQEERASLRTYLCAIARHLAFKQLRRQGQEAELDDPPDEVPGVEPPRDALRAVIDEEAAEAVREAVQALPALQREADAPVRVRSPEPGRDRGGLRD